MNKRQVISSLNNIAEELDNQGLYVEAKQISNVMKKIAQGPLNTPSQEPSGETAKSALFYYTNGEIATSISRPVSEARGLLKKVIDAYQSNKKFFNDPVYGAELKNRITEDMGLLNSVISAYNNFPRSNKDNPL